MSRTDELAKLSKLEQLFEDKLDKLEELEKTKNNDEFLKLCQCTDYIFNTPEGKTVMNFLSRYLVAPVSSADFTERQACVREGQNEIIRMLLNFMKTNLKNK